MRVEFQTLPQELMSGRETERRGARPSLRFAWALEDESLAHSGLEDINTPQGTQDERLYLQQSQERSIERLDAKEPLESTDNDLVNLKTLGVEKLRGLDNGKDTRRSHSNYPTVLPWNKN